MDRKPSKRRLMLEAMAKGDVVNANNETLEVCPVCVGKGRVAQYFRQRKMSVKGKELKPAGYVQLKSASGVAAARKRGETVEEGPCTHCARAGVVVKKKPGHD